MELVSIISGIIVGSFFGLWLATKFVVPIILDHALAAAQDAGLGEPFLQQISFRLGMLHKYRSATKTRSDVLRLVLQARGWTESEIASLITELMNA